MISSTNYVDFSNSKIIRIPGKSRNQAEHLTLTFSSHSSNRSLVSPFLSSLFGLLYRNLYLIAFLDIQIFSSSLFSYSSLPVGVGTGVLSSRIIFYFIISFTAVKHFQLAFTVTKVISRLLIGIIIYRILQSTIVKLDLNSAFKQPEQYIACTLSLKLGLL